MNVLVGHHGLFSLSPIWLLAVAGMVTGCWHGRTLWRQALFRGSVTSEKPVELGANTHFSHHPKAQPGPLISPIEISPFPWFVQPLGLALHHRGGGVLSSQERQLCGLEQRPALAHVADADLADVPDAHCGPARFEFPGSLGGRVILGDFRLLGQLSDVESVATPVAVRPDAGARLAGVLISAFASRGFGCPLPTLSPRTDVNKFFGAALTWPIGIFAISFPSGAGAELPQRPGHLVLFVARAKARTIYKKNVEPRLAKGG